MQVKTNQPVQVTILGSTGSIGVNTLKVIENYPEKFQLFALTAHKQIQLLMEQCLKYRPRYAVILEDKAALELTHMLRQQQCATEVLKGPEALIQVASHPEVNYVMAAIVGAAGLPPTLAAARAGKRILLANKEALVMTGTLFMQTVAQNNATLLPIDSEHNAIFQCMPCGYHCGQNNAEVKQILLTASGGPFLHTPIEKLQAVTPQAACAHPNWSMGQKISVDSATLMNKGLELIEACFLFNKAPDKVSIVIHPQSIIHSMVEYINGSVLAQLGSADMKIPIAYGLGWPDYIASGAATLDFFKLKELTFATPDITRFPCLQLALDAAVAGGNAPTLLNAANEVAVQSFLQQQIGFVDIAAVIAEVMHKLPWIQLDSIDRVTAEDAKARVLALEIIRKRLC